MIIFVIIVFFILIFSLNFRYNKEKYLNKNDTTVINGICTLLIFFSHSTQYWFLSTNFSDRLYQHFQNFHNQWIVAPFLFFSGYGVMWSIQNRESYLKFYPYNRIIKTLLNFDIVVIIYIIVSYLLGFNYSPTTILLSLVGIKSVGNSNWYIFAILFMYTASYISSRITTNKYFSVVILFLVTIIYCICVSSINMGDRFYSTIFCYPFGSFVAIYKDNIMNIIQNNKIKVPLVLLCILTLTYNFRIYPMIMNLSSVAIVMLLIYFLYFFEISSNILYFVGKHAFSIFILQRIPGMLLQNIYFQDDYMKYLMIILDLLFTIFLAIYFDKLIVKFDQTLFLKLRRLSRFE